jgi:hypothetical protein
MADELREPLPTTLRSIATALNMGVPHGTYSKGGGSYDWRGIVAQQRNAALAFLRTAFESKAQGRTIREAHASLLPANFPAQPIFLIVVCAASRAEGQVRQLASGDVLYLVTAPQGLGEGLVVRRLN